MDPFVIVGGTVLGGGLVMLLVPRQSTRTRRARGWLDEVGLAGVPASIIFLTIGVTGLAVGGVVGAAIPIQSVAPLGFLVGCALPVLVLASARDVRRRNARRAWPDIIDSMRMALRSGATLTDAVTSAESMVPRDWTLAWSGLDRDLRNGVETDRALRTLGRSLADPIADRVVESLIVAREYGGTELPEVLSELSRSLRAHNAIRAEAHSRQSWVRHAATLGIVAPWIVLGMLASRPENRAAYSTTDGSLLIVGAAAASIVAYFVMRAIGTLPNDDRWLVGPEHD